MGRSNSADETIGASITRRSIQDSFLTTRRGSCRKGALPPAAASIMHEQVFGMPRLHPFDRDFDRCPAVEGQLGGSLSQSAHDLGDWPSDGAIDHVVTEHIRLADLNDLQPDLFDDRLDRLGGVRERVGRALSVDQRAASHASETGGRVALPPERLSAVGRSHRRKMGREPLLSAFHRRDLLFQHRLPIDASSLTRWRKRIGEEGVEWLLTQTIEAGRKSGGIDESSVKRVAVDTTVMEKNIAHPTDARIYERARAHLVALAQEAGIDLRQTYARFAPRPD